jgi:hypothetical protein
MNWTRDYSTIRIATAESKTDAQGGLIPTSSERAKAADVITLPEGVEGTRCDNCVFIRKIEGKKYGYCVHPKVRMPVNNRMCCKWWNAEGTLRHFKFSQRDLGIE